MKQEYRSQAEAAIEKMTNDQLIEKIKLGSAQWQKMNKVQGFQRKLETEDRDDLEWTVKKMYAVLASRMNSRVGFLDDHQVLLGNDPIQQIERRRASDVDEKEMEEWRNANPPSEPTEWIMD